MLDLVFSQLRSNSYGLGHGIGAWLLRDAMLRALTAAETVGIRVLLVHAIDENVRRFYERHGFEASPTDPMNLQMLLKDVRASVDAAGNWTGIGALSRVRRW